MWRKFLRHIPARARSARTGLRWMLALFMLSSAVGMLALQTPNPPPVPRPKSFYFAGVVTGLTKGRITVSRSLAGRPRVNRTFLLKPQTKMSRSVRMNVRVTVRYQRLPEGDVALEIQVRPPTRATRPS